MARSFLSSRSKRCAASFGFRRLLADPALRGGGVFFRATGNEPVCECLRLRLGVVTTMVREIESPGRVDWVVVVCVVMEGKWMR